jgi:hypothetical protein
MNCLANAPIDVINYILSFDNRFRISNGIPISIIPKDDPRYSILKKVCRFHNYFIVSDNQRIDRYALGQPPCKPLSFLQDSLYIIIKQQKNNVSLYVEHRRITDGKQEHLYYSYTIHNYGWREPSARIRKKLRLYEKELNVI